MLPVKVVQHILGKYRTILKFSPAIYNQLHSRHKTHKATQLTSKVENAELDTNVKPLGEKVKETTKTVSYLGIILLGVTVTGTLFYAVFRELFSSNSPNNIYSKAAKKCIADPRVEDKLGLPITVHGDETRRGRRQHVSHVTYLDRTGKKHLRMQFYLKGSFHSGTVQLDMVENNSGNFEYRYIMVEVDDMLRNVIVVEDNRNNINSSNSVQSLMDA